MGVPTLLELSAPLSTNDAASGPACASSSAGAFGAAWSHTVKGVVATASYLLTGELSGNGSDANRDLQLPKVSPVVSKSLLYGLCGQVRYKYVDVSLPSPPTLSSFSEPNSVVRLSVPLSWSTLAPGVSPYVYASAQCLLVLEVR